MFYIKLTWIFKHIFNSIYGYTKVPQGKFAKCLYYT